MTIQSFILGSVIGQVRNPALEKKQNIPICACHNLNQTLYSNQTTFNI